MTDFYDKLYHFKSDLVGDPNKPQEGSHKTSSAFVSNIDRSIDRRFTEGGKTGGPNVSTPFKIEQWQTTHLKDNRLACGVGHIKTFCDDVIITL